MAVQPPTPPRQPPMPPGMPPAVPGAMPPGMKPGMAMPPRMAAGAGIPAGMAPGMKPAPGQLGAPGQPGAAGQAAVPENSLPQLSFFQQPWVQTVLPFVTSLVAHAVIIILGVTLAVTVVQQGKIIVQEEQTIIPESTMADQGPPGGVPNVGTNNDPLKQAMQDTTPDAGSAQGWADKASPNVDPAAAGGGSGEAESGLIGLGMGGLGKGGGLGTGSGNQSGGGQGDGGGPLAMFGTPGGGAIGPKGPVFGNGGNARKIVFVCDATGTMINKLGTLKHELTKTIAALRPIQSYNVVFFGDAGKYFIADKNGLIMANPDNKRNTYAFFEDIVPAGQTDPIPAIEAAFKQQPQLLYFLSDGEFNNLKSYDEVIAAFSKANVGKKVKVNTILFETYDKEAEEVMSRIASENGGTYVYRREADLQ